MIQSILAQIKRGKLWQYAGGVFPAERKSLSNQQPIAPAQIPNELIIPLNQHIGEVADLLVNVGDKVLKGQALTNHNNFRALPVHASSSGTVKAIEPRPSCHASGLAELSIVIATDGKDAWRERIPTPDFTVLDRHAIIDKIHLSGIAGKGGAGFPAHIKLSVKADIELLIINGIECEPYITSDDMLMREYADELIKGIEILEFVTQCKQTVIAIESNKPEAIAALSAFDTDTRRVTSVPTKYPSGGEKQLIELLTGKQVPSSGYPIDMGILMHNVGTAFAIKRAVIDDEPLISRIVTITGEAFKEKGNAQVLLGTPIQSLLQQFELEPQPNGQTRLIIGGPMMGFTLPDAMAPVIKTTNCLLAPTVKELPPPGQEMACIRCGECADACPVSLLPQQLYWYAKDNDHEKLNDYNLFDCIECGSCAYVCPSEIPLVQYYRIAKADIRKQETEKKKAEIARIRHEARQERLDREKAAREAKHKEAAAKRKAQLNAAAKSESETATAPAKDKAQDAVAQALARAKAKRQPPNTNADTDVAAARAARKEQARLAKAAKAAQEQADDSATTAQEQQTEAKPKATNPAVAAAIARAKAKKETQQAENEAQASEENSAPSKNPAVAAAIARAKAKKEAQQDDNETSAPQEKPAPSKNPAVAAAIARAKAKKEALQDDNETPAPQEKTAPSKNPAVAAAIARAKAKKAAQQAETGEPQPQSATAEQDDNETPAPQEKPAPSKNPAVAAAIARAKAKKEAQQAEKEEPQPQSATAEQEDNKAPAPQEKPAPSKNPAVAAAIARAKAKKAAQQAEKEEPQPQSATAEQEDNKAPAPQEKSAPSKNPAVAAAIARAKAKKAQQKDSTES
ncbi:electron transport complex subunit RsxC [Motilimonas sp. E26]|uniref:electron transport complex subunit RsxC n=1 Tax=Motilimonas sp. E26 TaxID=2865674 RepID=UPI001EE5CA7E|nr:electron transport complex subunit RsxC [Motilimonas sp. E26]